MAAADGASWTHADLAVTRACVGAHAVSVAALYQFIAAAGLQLGHRFRSLYHVWTDRNDIWASARLRSRRSANDGTVVHPAELDGAMQLGLTRGASSGRGSGHEGQTRLPFAVDDARLRGASGKPWAVRGRSCACCRSSSPY